MDSPGPPVPGTSARVPERSGELSRLAEISALDGGADDTMFRMEAGLVSDHRGSSRRVEVAWLVAATLAGVELVSIGLRASAGTLDADSIASLAFLSLPLCGAVIVNQQPWNRLGWVFLVVGSAAIVSANTTGGGLPAFDPSARDPWIGLVSDLTWPIGFPLLVATVPLLFPDGYAGRRWRWALGTGLAGVVLLVAGIVTGRWDDPSHGGPNPLSLANQTPSRLATPIGLALVAVAGAAGVVRLALNFRSGDSNARRQIRDLLALTVVLGALIVVAAIAGSVTALPGWVDESLPALALLGYPIAITIAVLRRRLFGHSFVLHRSSIVRLSQLAAVAVILGVAALVSGKASVTPEGAFVIGVFGCAAAVAGAAAAGGSVRTRVIGHGTDPGAVFERLSAGDGSDLPFEEWALIARDAVRSPRVELAVVGTPPVSVGRPVDLPAVELLLGDTGDVGRLLVSRRSAAEEFDGRETALLEGIAALITAAARHARVAEQAQRAERSLARVTAVERERLHRDLHDQLGPRLAGIGYLLNAVEPVPGSREHLDAARSELVAASGEVRRLARNLTPSPVERFGLTEAIRRHASQWADLTSIDLHLDLDPSEGISDRAASALYSVTLEALNNIGRHAHASTCVVCLRADGERICLEVTDNGTGIERARAHDSDGVGLESMRTRARELGGRVDISTESDGTLVRFEVPVDA